MTRIAGTTATTAVPMQGYEEALSKWEPALAVDFSSPFPCRNRNLFAKVRSVYLAFFLDSIKACARDERTRPIELRVQADGGKMNLRPEPGFVGCQTSQTDEDHFETFDMFLASQPEVDIRAFLEKVYDLGQRDLQAATDKVFDTIDRLLCDGRESVCDEILAHVDVTRLPSALLRSFLTITAPAREKLCSRRFFYARAYGEVERQRGADMAKRLLGRLA
jgi:hypothetical protein